MKRKLYMLSALICLTTTLSADLQHALGQLTTELNNLKNALQKSKVPSISPKSNVHQVTTPSSFIPRGLLIFLDESERGRAGALSNAILEALASEAGPIIASTSLVANVSRTAVPLEKNPKKLLQLYNHLLHIDEVDMTEIELKQEEEIILSTAGFRATEAKKWVIKEINASLLLLIPLKYLQSLTISEKNVEIFTSKDQITSTESVLGLKVNHMKTLRFNDITTPVSEHAFADYFIEALPAIFVTNSEYAKNNTTVLPAWAMYIEGHGLMNHSIAYLSLTQFKSFLAFLESKIYTKLLFYNSCYAAGVNTELLYKDAEKGIEKTYPFTIITGALTDSPTEAWDLELYIDQGKLRMKIRGTFSHFLHQVTTSDVIDYPELTAPFLIEMKSFKESEDLESKLDSLPQIKFPGLPWFSVLNSDKVVSIGSIIAKTRTQPLLIATFFKNKKEVEPLGVLLYAKQIPFELIINTKAMPAIISMIPGSTVHRIKKISSTIHYAESIVASFLTLYDLAPRKIFSIDELTSPLSDPIHKELKNPKGTVQNVIIDTSEGAIYFTYNNTIYSIDENNHPLIVSDQKTQKTYRDLLALSNPTKAPRPNLQATLAPFTKTMTAQQAEEEIKHALDTMPDNSILRVPQITANQSEQGSPWFYLPVSLEGYKTLPNTHKIIWINKITLGAVTICSDLVIDSRSAGTRVFFKGSDNKPVQATQEALIDLIQDYTPIYSKMFQYFQQHKTLDETSTKEIGAVEQKSIQQLLTPEAIIAIKASQEKKIKGQQKKK